MYVRLATRFDGSATPVVFALNHSASIRGRPLQRSWFGGERVRFEKAQYLAPKVPEYLATLYGPDFMTPPPEGNRIGHPKSRLWARLGGRTWGRPEAEVQR